MHDPLLFWVVVALTVVPSYVLFKRAIDRDGENNHDD